jgi:hypothetical protein
MNQPFHTVQALRFIGDIMEVTVDGRTHAFDVAAVSARLAKASPTERNVWKVSPSGYGLHWPLLDEDVAIDGLLRLASVPPAPATRRERAESTVHEPPARYGGSRRRKA